MRYQLFIGGIEYPFISLTYKQNYQILSQRIDVVLPRIETIAHDAILEIKRDGATVAKGRVKRLEYPHSADDVSMNIFSYDAKRKWHMLDAVELANYQTADAEVDAQLPNTDLTKGTFNTGPSIIVEYGMGADSRFKRDRAVEDVCFLTGWEFQELPDWTCNFKAQCGTDLSGSVKFIMGQTLDRWREPYVETSLLKVKKVRIIGSGTSWESLKFGHYQSGDYAEGDPMTTIVRKSLNYDDMCTLAAEKCWDDLKNTIKYGIMEVIDTTTGCGFGVFDTVYVEDSYIGLATNLRIFEISRYVTGDGKETTVVGVCNITHLQTNADYLIGKIRDRTEDDYSVQAQIPAMVDVLPRGSVFPTTGLIDGQLFYHTGWDMLFRWDATNNWWVSVDYDGSKSTLITVDAAGANITVTDATTGMTITYSTANITIQKHATGITITDHVTGMVILVSTTGMTILKNTTGVTNNSGTTGITNNTSYQEKVSCLDLWTLGSDTQLQSYYQALRSGTSSSPTGAIDCGLIEFWVERTAGNDDGQIVIAVGSNLYEENYVWFSDEFVYHRGLVFVNESLSNKTIEVRARGGTSVYAQGKIRAWCFKEHTHTVSEGSGHGHGHTEPESGTGHPHTPSEGTGHDHDPSEGTGHPHNYQEPESGAGHDHLPTDPTHPHSPVEGAGHDHPDTDPTHPHDTTDPEHLHQNTKTGDPP